VIFINVISELILCQKDHTALIALVDVLSDCFVNIVVVVRLRCFIVLISIVVSRM